MSNSITLAQSSKSSESVSDVFKVFLSNLQIDNTEQISSRYGEITSALNKKFRDTESKTSNTLQVGSFGRRTGIKGISDLDMLYIMPKSKRSDYGQDGGQRKLLVDVKDAILARYPKTDVKVDRLVVTVSYTNFHVEVQPVFEQDDGSYEFPDTYDGGSWRITKPREEMQAMSELDSEKNYNLKRLCKMVRAWKNKHGLGIGGLLIDTLAYKYLDSTDVYDTKSYSDYDVLVRDFFEYISELEDQEYYLAPGSNQRVNVKCKFQSKAKKALKLCNEAIASEGNKNYNAKWKKVFGRPFPAQQQSTESVALSVVHASDGHSDSTSHSGTEQFIEDLYPVDVKYSVSVNCRVKQDGYREMFLLDMLSRRIHLTRNRSLKFYIESISVPEPYEIKWKVLNRGAEAVARNEIRGQILTDWGRGERTETSTFKGDHIVDCYIIKDGVVVAKDRIDVPIVTGLSS